MPPIIAVFWYAYFLGSPSECEVWRVVASLHGAVHGEGVELEGLRGGVRGRLGVLPLVKIGKLLARILASQVRRVVHVET